MVCYGNVRVYVMQNTMILAAEGKKLKPRRGKRGKRRKIFFLRKKLKNIKMYNSYPWVIFHST